MKANRKIIQARTIDTVTGEVLFSTQRASKVKYFDEEKGYLFWARKSFSKSFADIDFPDDMSDLEIGRMARLAKRIWSNTNMLGYRGNGGVRAYSIDMIADILKIKTRQAYRFIEKMIRLGVLARVTINTDQRKETQLYVNPIYFFSSNRIPLSLYLIFHRQLDQYIPKWAQEAYGGLKGYG